MSEYIGQRERCPHLSCNHQERLEYCAEAAAETEGRGAFIIDILDDLLYGQVDFGRGGFEHRATADGHIFKREFSLLDGEVEEVESLALFETKVVIEHSFDKQLGAHRYLVSTVWDTLGDKADPSGFRVDYAIDKYPEGKLQAEITEPDLKTELLRPDQPLSYDSRPATIYDYKTLKDNILDKLCEIRSVKIDDDLRANIIW